LATKKDDGTVELTYHQKLLTFHGQNEKKSKWASMKLAERHSKKIATEYRMEMEKKEF
jgi:hypothetical protein